VRVLRSLGNLCAALAPGASHSAAVSRGPSSACPMPSALCASSVCGGKGVPDVYIDHVGGSSPSDLDSYLQTPAPPSGGDECLIWYRNRKCFQDSIKYTHLDLDATSHSSRGGKPETITIGYLSTGRYVFYAKEYRGVNEQGLLNSGAVASFYAEGFQRRCRVGRDGYLQGPTWYVFWIDGTTKEITPCDPDACPPV